jgi:hypothetical protein
MSLVTNVTALIFSMGSTLSGFMVSVLSAAPPPPSSCRQRPSFRLGQATPDPDRLVVVALPVPVETGQFA